MTFIREKVPQNYVEQLNLKKLGDAFWTSNFDHWTVDYERNVFVFYIRTSIMPEDEDFGVSYFLLNIQNSWIKINVITLDSGGSYGGETWVKYKIIKIEPIEILENYESKRITFDDLSVDIKTVETLFCEALVAWSKSRNESTSSQHIVFIENLTIVGAQS